MIYKFKELLTTFMLFAAMMTLVSLTIDGSVTELMAYGEREATSAELRTKTVRLDNIEPEAISEVVMPLEVSTGLGAERLASLLDEAWTSVGDPNLAPDIAAPAMPADLSALPVRDKKLTFLRALLPHVLRENARISTERDLVLNAATSSKLTPEMVDNLAKLAARYKLRDLAAKQMPDSPAPLIKKLLERIDTIPPSLALAQGAIESAWGTSRFAREGNNLFGQWIFNAEGGMAPKDRPEGAKYSVARYPDIAGSVAAYMRNLNSGWAYKELRAMRAGLRKDDRTIDGIALAAGLVRYSQRGENYVREVRAVIGSNDLTRFDALNLAPVSPELAGKLAALKDVNGDGKDG